MNEKERTATILHAIDNMTEGHLRCRDYGHVWAAHWAERLPGKQGFYQELRCPRCEMVRFRNLDIDGNVITSRYRQPPGYGIAGVGRMTGSDRGQLRLASVIGTIGKKPAKGGRK